MKNDRQYIVGRMSEIVNTINKGHRQLPILEVSSLYLMKYFTRAVSDFSQGKSLRRFLMGNDVDRSLQLEKRMSHQDKVNEEVERLCKEFIPRLGEIQPDGRIGVRYGILFDDEEGQQYFEAIVGTLKAAKRQNLIDFKGQMLLKGAHDNVIIYLNSAP